jgi:Spherulation-specific family 4
MRRTDAGRAGTTEKRLRLGIPAYFYPDNNYWPQLQNGAPAVGLAVANPSDGPGTDVDPRYVMAIRQTRGRGIRVLGYVTTSYGSRGVRQVASDIDRWHRWYEIDGIFLDEVSTSPTQLTDCIQLFTYIRKRHGSRHLVVINSGTQTLEGFMYACDILLNNESSWLTYRDAYVENPNWVSKYSPSRFWHLVHGCSSESDMRMVLRLACARHAAWIYVTNGTGSNPYRLLPGGRYWLNELRFAATVRS